MTSIFEIIFWICAGALIHSYVLYPATAFLLASVWQTFRDMRFIRGRSNRRSAHREEFLPQVAIIVAAYNEEHHIQAKLRNTLELDYPAGRMEFLLGLDAPTDSTAAVAASVQHPSVRLFNFEERRGKLAVINDLIQRTTADIIVFSDANTTIERDCLRRLVRHFADSDVGAVCGEVRVVDREGNPRLESLYWKFEVALKFVENRLNCVLGANGPVYAIRRELYNLNRHWIVEDFQIPMEIRFAGHRVVYDPEAIAVEEAAPTLKDEFRRKVRIGAGDFQTMSACPHFLNPLIGMPALAYFSHKVLRWLGPFFLLGAWISSGVLALRGLPVYQAAFVAQCGLYLLALTGELQDHGRRAGRLTSAAYYFTMMNVALLFGFFRFLSGGQGRAWDRTPRNVAAPVAIKSGGQK